MKKLNIFVSAIMLAFTTSGAMAQTITGGSSHSPIPGGARILEAQGDTPANPAIGFHSTASTPSNPRNDGGGGNGIFRPIANTMGFATASLERMRINSNGLIGIGTTIPTAQLEVTAIPSGGNRGIIGLGKNTGVFGEAYHLNAGLTEDGILHGLVEAIGVFGKGTFASTLSSNAHIYGVVGSATAANPDNNIGIFGEAKNGGVRNIGIKGLVDSPNGNMNSAIIGEVRLNTTATYNRAISGYAPLSPNHFAGYFEGKVAIADGTQANNYVLTSDATGLASWADPATLPGLGLGDWHTTGNTASTGDFIGTNNAEPLPFHTSGTEKARITTSGEMGIGTTSPTAQLEVTALPSNGQKGIIAKGLNTGLFGEAYHMNATLTEEGIVNGWSEAIGVFGKGTYSFPTTGNGNIFGVVGSAAASNPLNNVGVYGEAKNANGYNTGVYGSVVSDNTKGIYNSGVAGRVELNNTAIWNRAINGFAPVAPNHFAGYFEGKLAVVDGTQANNYVLTSDANGTASWKDPATIPSLGIGDWHTTGNTGVLATDYIGTGAGEINPFVLKTNATEVARITSAGLTGFGTTNPLHKLQVHDGALMLSGNVAGFGGPQLLFTDDATTHPNGKWAIEYIKPISGTGPGTRPSMGGLNFWKPWNAANPPGLAYNYTLFLKDDGKVGMGVTDENGDANFCATALPNGYRLYVNGGILTTKVKVANYCSGAWADYVFAKDYKLKPLSEVETFIKANKHLPNIPSGEQIEKEGLDLADMQAKQMEKIEELTLYMIEMKKEIDSLKKQNESLLGKVSKN